MCMFTNEGDTLLDPFAGTGVINQVGLRTRRVIEGIELFDDTAKAAMQRCRAYYRWILCKLPKNHMLSPTEQERANPYVWYIFVFQLCASHLLYFVVV